MKQTLVTAYTFIASTRSVDLSSITSFNIKRLYAIINITANQIIYAVGIPAYGLSSIIGSTITLVYDTSSMSNSDTLAIIYDTVNTDLSNAYVTKLTDGTNSQSYTASGESKVLVTPLTNASVIKAQLQDNSGSAITLGQKAMASSVPVTISSDQSAIPSTQSGTWNVNNISGTISLPTNSAQESGGHLSSIDTKLGSGPTAQDSTVANVQGSVGAGVAASKSNLSGGVFNTAFPTLTNGQQSALQLDSSGRLVVRPFTSADIVSAVQSGTWNINNISGTVSLPTGASTEATLSALNTKFNSLGQKVMAGSAPVVIASDQSAIPTSQSGTWTVQQGTPPWSIVGNIASGLSDSGNPVKIGGVFNTAFPTLTNGQRGDIQLDSSARQIIAPLTNTSIVKSQLQDNAGTAITLGQKAMASSLPVVIASDQSNLLSNITQIGGSALTLGQASAASSIPVVTQADSSPATQNITAQDIASSTATGANNQSFITGTPTANSAASFSLSSFESIEVQVTGTWTGTLQTEVSMDNGTTWFIRGLKQSGVAYIASSFTANFEGGLNFGGMTNFRVRATAAMTGTATIRIVASTNTSSIIVVNPQMFRDGTTQSILNTIKAASIAAAVSDTALVVGFSPNSPLPTGANTLGIVATKTALTASSPAAATVGVSSAQALASNANRKGLVLVNTSANTISFGLGASAVLNSGITLFPGGTWVMDEYNFTTATINAIASVASSNLSIQEFST